MGCVWDYIQNGKWSYAIGGNMVTRNKNKLVERKASVDTGEIKGTDLKDKFFVLVFCGFPDCLDEGKGCKLQYAA